jgi:hypothetical protein
MTIDFWHRSRIVESAPRDTRTHRRRHLGNVLVAMGVAAVAVPLLVSSPATPVDVRLTPSMPTSESAEALGAMYCDPDPVMRYPSIGRPAAVAGEETSRGTATAATPIATRTFRMFRGVCMPDSFGIRSRNTRGGGGDHGLDAASGGRKRTLRPEVVIGWWWRACAVRR